MSKEILKWIKDVREGCKKVIEQDGREIFKIMKKGHFETETLYKWLMEVRDNEREDALLSLIQGMLEEEIKLKEVKK